MLAPRACVSTCWPSDLFLGYAPCGLLALKEEFGFFSVEKKKIFIEVKRLLPTFSACQGEAILNDAHLSRVFTKTSGNAASFVSSFGAFQIGFAVIVLFFFIQMSVCCWPNFFYSYTVR